MITVIYNCGGCSAKAEGQLKRTFQSFSGRPWGFGVYRETTAQEAAPAGWIAFDPWTGCTYCPTCWREIIEEPSVLQARLEKANP